MAFTYELFHRRLCLMVGSGTLTLPETSEFHGYEDVVVGSFMTSWMSRSRALELILGGR